MELRPSARADAEAAARLQLWLERHWGLEVWKGGTGRGWGTEGVRVAFRHELDSEICFSTVTKQLRPRAFAQPFQIFWFKKKRHVLT